MLLPRHLDSESRILEKLQH